MEVRVQAKPFNFGAEAAAFAEGHTKMGAVVTFTGIVRDVADGLDRMEIEHYPGMTEQALEGTVTWSKNLTATFNKAIAAIDAKLSEQLAVVMHAPEFRELEGTWRGLQYLVMNSETSSTRLANRARSATSPNTR